MPQQEICWFCGLEGDDCEYLMQSPLRPVKLNLSAKSTDGWTTGKITIEGKAHAYICEVCARTARSIIAEDRHDPGQGHENRKGAAATNNHAPEHKE